VKYITDQGKIVVVDIHGGARPGDKLTGPNSGAYRENKIGKTWNGVSVTDMFLNLWWNLAGIFKGNPNVWFGVTNEPVDIDPAVWWKCAQDLITKVRGQGFTGWIAMPGLYYTGAATWVNSGNAANFEKLVDPLNKTCAQVHLYGDANSGGGPTDVVSTVILVERFKQTMDWALLKGKKVLLGEVAVKATATYAKEAWANLDALMDKYPDTVLGWCWWARGADAWWGGYQFTLCSTTTGKPQVDMLKPSFATTLAAPVDPKDALIEDLKKQLAQALSDYAACVDRLNAANADIARWTDRVKVLEGKIDAIRTVVA